MKRYLELTQECIKNAADEAYRQGWPRGLDDIPINATEISARKKYVELTDTLNWLGNLERVT